MIDWLIDWLLACLIDWLIDWLIAWLLDCLIVWLIDWSIAWLMDLVWFVLLYLIGIGLDLSTTTYFSWFTSLCRWTLVEAIRWWTLIQACWTKHNGCHPQRASLASRFDRDADLVLRSFTWKPMRRCHLLQGGARNTFSLMIYVWCLHQCFFSRKTFRRRVLQKIVGVSHTTHIPHISHTTHIPHISITPHISHTYPFKTYPTNTYPTNTYPFNTYPTSTYPCNAYPFKTFASAGFAIRIPPIRIPPIRIPPTRIPPIRIHAMRIHSMRIHSKGVHQQESQNVSHQYISHQYVSSTRIPPVRIHSMRIHSKSLHQQEWQWVWVSLHIISYHCYSAGMVMNIETLLFLQFLCKIINWI